MNSNLAPSRRSVLSSLAVLPLPASSFLSVGRPTSDADLIALGLEIETATSKIDNSISQATDIDHDTLEQLAKIGAKIVATPATTVDGLRVKARIACWALLGDLDSNEDATFDKSMALSIVRDLIRLYDPQLENPGALRKLVKEIEDNASSSRADQRQS